MTLRLIVGPHDVLPRSFPSLVDSYCSTQTLSNWTNSPRPYRSLEEPSRHGTALLLFLILCVSRPVVNTIYPSFLLLSSLPQLFFLLVTKEGCGDAKKWCSCFISPFCWFFSTSKLTKLLVLVVTKFSHGRRETHAVSLKVTDVNFFGTRSFLTTTSLSFQSSHQSDFVCDLRLESRRVVWALAILRNRSGWSRSTEP